MKTTSEVTECDSDDECTVSEICKTYFSEPETLCGHFIFFGIAAALMAVTLLVCPLCVWGVLVLSCACCLRYRSMNLILWACIVVLWIMGWRFSFGHGLSFQWQ